MGEDEQHIGKGMATAYTGLCERSGCSFVTDNGSVQVLDSTGMSNILWSWALPEEVGSTTRSASEVHAEQCQYCYGQKATNGKDIQRGATLKTSRYWWLIMYLAFCCPTGPSFSLSTTFVDCRRLNPVDVMADRMLECSRWVES